MKNHELSGLRILALGCLLLISLTSVAFEEPVDVPATPSERVTLSPLVAVTAAGERLVAVGPRGHVIVSDDHGANWQQANVPVSIDLVAVSFATPELGWAVGHAGVVIHTEDGGLNWSRQLEGRQTAEQILAFYSEQVAAGDEQAQLYVDREQSLVDFGGTQPLMDVYFQNAQTGYAVGVFNRLLRTDDGGRSWMPWAHRIDNPAELHLYSISAGEGGLFITGEQGMVWKLDEQGEQFVAIPAPYDGTLFGSINNKDVLVAYGMRGSVFRSQDQGASWERVASNSQAGITDGLILQNGDIVLANLAGEVQVSRDQAQTFTAQSVAQSMPFFGLATLDQRQLTLIGAEGVRHQAVVLQESLSMQNEHLVVGANHVIKPQEQSHGTR